MNGPFYKNESATFPGTTKRVYSLSQTRYTSSTPPPYKDVMPYEVRKHFVSPGPMDWDGVHSTMPYTDGPNGFAAEAVVSGRVIDNNALIAALELARSRSFLSSSAGTTMAESREAVSMIATRCSSLYQSLRAAKRGDWKGICDALLIPRVPPGSRRKRGSGRKTQASVASSLWLEYWFGWSPLLQDIHDSVAVLQGGNDGSPKKIVAYGRRQEVFSKSAGFPYPPPRGNNSVSASLSYEVRYGLGFDLTVENPQAALANQLGLSNPATIAWELVPFSFVVDWFIPVQGFLNQGNSAWRGFRLSKAFTSVKRVCRSSGIYNWYRPYSGDSIWLENSDLSTYSVRFVRTLGISQAGFPTYQIKRLSLTRAATSVALLVGFSKTL